MKDLKKFLNEQKFKRRQKNKQLKYMLKYKSQNEINENMDEIQ